MGDLKEFVMLFRFPDEHQIPGGQPSVLMDQKWKKFIALIASQVKLVNVSQLSSNGIVIKSDLSIETKPLKENGSIIIGNLTMKSKTIEDVISIAKKCPILLTGGTVEIRETVLIK